jgi:UDP-N-acetylmuramoylalanine--D-glutamate ligase
LRSTILSRARADGDNLSCAAQLVLELKWPWDQAWGALKQFGGLEHRLEFLGEASEITFVNDSKATTIESVLSAAKSLEDIFQKKSSSSTLWLLLGGKDKNLPWNGLAPLQSFKALHPVYFGDCREKVRKGLGLEGPEFPKLQEALSSLKKWALAGDVILLSPGGTSLDEFKSFEDRGDHFKKWVGELWGVLK